MEPVVIALASNESYFPGLYCAIAGALGYLDREREVDVKVLDGGLSQSSRDTLSKLVWRMRKQSRLEFVTADASIFGEATLGPNQSRMTYYRLLLPHLLDVTQLIYIDCDVLVFRDLSLLFDHELPAGKILAAVPDSETLTLSDDSDTIARTLNLPPNARYFNAGVMLMDVKALRKENFTEKSLEFFRKWRGEYRFWDQSAMNFLLHRRIDELPEHWNRAAWRFDQQQNNELGCLLHYTTSAPWLQGPPGPAQVLFERFAKDAGLASECTGADSQRSRRLQFFRNTLAPLRALGFPLISLFCRISGQKDKSEGYKKAGRYWLHYMLHAPRRRRLHRSRVEEIQAMNFRFNSFEFPA